MQQFGFSDGFGAGSCASSQSRVPIPQGFRLPKDSVRLSEPPRWASPDSSTLNTPKTFQADVKNQMLLPAVKHDVKSYTAKRKINTSVRKPRTDPEKHQSQHTQTDFSI